MFSTVPGNSDVVIHSLHLLHFQNLKFVCAHLIYNCLHLMSATRCRMWGPYHFTRSRWCIETSQSKPVQGENITSHFFTEKIWFKNRRTACPQFSSYMFIYLQNRRCCLWILRHIPTMRTLPSHWHFHAHEGCRLQPWTYDLVVKDRNIVILTKF